MAVVFRLGVLAVVIARRVDVRGGATRGASGVYRNDLA